MVMAVTVFHFPFPSAGFPRLCRLPLKRFIFRIAATIQIEWLHSTTFTRLAGSGISLADTFAKAQ
jgi:hypothetical protein